MNWKQIYIERSKNKGQYLRDYVKTRIKRYKNNPPILPKHFSELDFLIINYDFQKGLLRKYSDIISKETKDKWLEKKLIINKCPANKGHVNTFYIKLPLLLLNPNFNHKELDYYFLIDQLIIVMNSIDHKHKRYRLVAENLLVILTAKFTLLESNVRTRILETLLKRTTKENIKKIKKLFVKHVQIIPENLFNEFVDKQLRKQLITLKLAIGIYRRKEYLNKENIKKLKQLILEYDSGKKIIEQLNI